MALGLSEALRKEIFKFMGEKDKGWEDLESEEKENFWKKFEDNILPKLKPMLDLAKEIEEEIEKKR